MKTVALAAAFGALAAPALAHTGHGETSGLLHGLAHPLLGPDHLLAMLGVGIWSGLALPRHLWAGAATFLAAMTAGAGLAWAGVSLPMVEGWILASVVLAGLLVATARTGQARGLTALSLAAIATFAACHGQAHAIEATGPLATYLAGFLASTAALHLAGILIARATGAGLPQRLVGGALAGAGLLMLAG